MIAKALSTSERFAALHEETPKLAEFCQSLYPLLLAHADDFGCLQGDPFTVKHLVHPTSPRKVAEFHAALTALHNVRLITWYEADDPEGGEPRRYIYIRGWFAHQHLKGHDSDGRKRTYPEPPENHSKIDYSAQSCPIPPKSAPKRREEKRTEEEEKRREPGAEAPEASSLTPQELGVMWNQVARDVGLPTCREVTGERAKKAKARIAEHSDPSYWRLVIGRIGASEFCRGSKGWRADFDFLVRPDTHVKVLEGKYDARGDPIAPPGSKTTGNAAAGQRFLEKRLAAS